MNIMKKICVALPCYNEADNVTPLAAEIIKQFEMHLPEYEYELRFIDNCSTDGTREKLRLLCAENKKIKAIFNVKNFNDTSAYYNLINCDGDCAIAMATDFQDPPELIPQLVKEWENGYKIVALVKTKSAESSVMYFIRSIYYKLMKLFSSTDQIEHFTGAGLYDKEFLKVCRELNDQNPSMRGIVAELGYKVKTVPFEQPKRRFGKSKQFFGSLFSVAIRNITSYTNIGIRIATIGGFVASFISFVIAIGYLVAKFLYWETFSAGTAPILIGMFFIGSLQLFFIGLIGEYVLSINTRIMNRPYVIEEERINFGNEKGS